MPANGRVFKTIVTSDLGRVIAEYYGASTEDVLTGFKFIGEKIKQYEETKEFEFLFGYEESYGYLVKSFARDKDAVQSVLAIVEAAAYYKEKGMTLVDVLYALYERHGYYLEGLVSVTKKGVSGANAIQNLLEQVRINPAIRSCRNCCFIARRLFNVPSNIYRWSGSGADFIAKIECIEVLSCRWFMGLCSTKWNRAED